MSSQKQQQPGKKQIEDLGCEGQGKTSEEACQVKGGAGKTSGTPGRGQQQQQKGQSRSSSEECCEGEEKQGCS